MTLHKIRSMCVRQPGQGNQPSHQINSPTNLHAIFYFSLIFIYLYVCVCVCVLCKYCFSWCFFYARALWAATIFHLWLPDPPPQLSQPCVVFPVACALTWGTLNDFVSFVIFCLHQQFMCYLCGWMHKQNLRNINKIAFFIDQCLTNSQLNKFICAWRFKKYKNMPWSKV